MKYTDASRPFARVHSDKRIKGGRVVLCMIYHSQAKKLAIRKIARMSIAIISAWISFTTSTLASRTGCLPTFRGRLPITDHKLQENQTDSDQGSADPVDTPVFGLKNVGWKNEKGKYCDGDSHARQNPKRGSPSCTARHAISPAAMQKRWETYGA